MSDRLLALGESTERVAILRDEYWSEDASLRDRVEELNARLRETGRHSPGYTIIHGSDERKRAGVEARLRVLRAKMPA